MKDQGFGCLLFIACGSYVCTKSQYLLYLILLIWLESIYRILKDSSNHLMKKYYIHCTIQKAFNLFFGLNSFPNSKTVARSNILYSVFYDVKIIINCSIVFVCLQRFYISSKSYLLTIGLICFGLTIGDNSFLRDSREVNSVRMTSKPSYQFRKCCRYICGVIFEIFV